MLVRRTQQRTDLRTDRSRRAYLVQIRRCSRRRRREGGGRIWLLSHQVARISADDRICRVRAFGLLRLRVFAAAATTAPACQDRAFDVDVVELPTAETKQRTGYVTPTVV